MDEINYESKISSTQTRLQLKTYSSAKSSWSALDSKPKEIKDIT